MRSRPSKVLAASCTPAPAEATAVRWVDLADLDAYDIHPTIRLRIEHGVGDGAPYVG